FPEAMMNVDAPKEAIEERGEIVVRLDFVLEDRGAGNHRCLSARRGELRLNIRISRHPCRAIAGRPTNITRVSPKTDILGGTRHAASLHSVRHSVLDG